MDLLDAGEIYSSQFDTAYTMTVLYAVEDKEAALESLVKSLKPGGRLILLEYDLTRPDEWIDGELLSTRPLPSEKLIAGLERLGLDCVKEDISARFACWYETLVNRLQCSRVSCRYPQHERERVLAKYQGILSSIRRGILGGVLVTAPKTGRL